MNQPILNVVTDVLESLKAKEILTYDVRGNNGITDDMVICTGASSRQVVGIANNLVELCKQQGIPSYGEEGSNTGEWIVVDLGQVIVHVMQSEAREHYQLEKLWI